MNSNQSIGPVRGGFLRVAIALLIVAIVGVGTGCRSESVHLAAANAVGPYSAAVAAGDVVWLAGKIGDPTLEFRAEVGTAIDAIDADLARLGLTLADVVSMNVFVTDIGRFSELNEIYAARFPAPYPARTTVAVVALPKGAHVELQAIARRN